MSLDAAAARAAAAITEAGALVITAGAGMGVDSGLPDFRGNEGFWRAYPPYQKLGLSFAQMADGASFQTDPELAWGFYGHRLRLYRATQPHAGFDLLREWSADRPRFIFTSNVDGQFQRSGFAPEEIWEAHGSIHHLQCSEPCSHEIWPADGVEVQIDTESMRALPPLPKCPHCGRVARPNILMFGDWMWVSERTDVQQSRFRAFARRISGSRAVVVEMGAGSAIPTVRLFGERLAAESDATLIRINPREPEIPPALGDSGVSLPCGALEGLRLIAAALGRG